MDMFQALFAAFGPSPRRNAPASLFEQPPPKCPDYVVIGGHPSQKSATPNRGATLVTKMNAFLHDIWDGVLIETMGMDQAWKHHRQVLTLCGNISMASDKEREELEAACEDAWSVLSVSEEWKAAKQPLEASQLVAFSNVILGRLGFF